MNPSSNHSPSTHLGALVEVVVLDVGRRLRVLGRERLVRHEETHGDGDEQRKVAVCRNSGWLREKRERKRREKREGEGSREEKV